MIEMKKIKWNMNFDFLKMESFRNQDRIDIFGFGIRIFWIWTMIEMKMIKWNFDFLKMVSFRNQERIDIFGFEN